MGAYWLAPPDEYDRTVRVLRRCGLMSNYFDHLFSQDVPETTFNDVWQSFYTVDPNHVGTEENSKQ